MDGILLFDKPVLWTSHDAVDFVRRRTGQRAVGHAGTLDPMATGLLVLLLGKATKRSQEFSSFDKDYRGIFTLGVSTDSQDFDGKIIATASTEVITAARVARAFDEHVGKQEQVPPAFSAVKKDGKRSYELARQGKAVPMAAREITIQTFNLERYEEPDACFFVSCSKGTYIRALAHSVGEKLGVGGSLSCLVRTRVGPFRLEQALSETELETFSRQQISAAFVEGLPAGRAL